MTARRPPFALVLGALVAGAVLWSLGGLEPHDESWFVQVTDRVAGGETLYKDVAYGATPLAVYVALPLVWLFGAQILWVKALVVGCFVASLLLLVSIGRRIGATNLELAAAGVALLVWSPPIRAALYQPLATTLLLAALAAMLAWRDSRATPDGRARRGARRPVLRREAERRRVRRPRGGGRGARRRRERSGSRRGRRLGRLRCNGRAHPRSRARDGRPARVLGLRLREQGGVREPRRHLVRRRVREPALRRALPGARRRRRGHGGRARLRAGGVRPRSGDPAGPRRRLASHARGGSGPYRRGGRVLARGRRRDLPAGGHGARELRLPRAARRRASARRRRSSGRLACAPPSSSSSSCSRRSRSRGGSGRSRSSRRGRRGSRNSRTRAACSSSRRSRPRSRTRRPRCGASRDRCSPPPRRPGSSTSSRGSRTRRRTTTRSSSAFGSDGEERLAADVERGRFAAVCVDFGTDPAVLPTRLAAAILRSLTPAEDLGVCRIYRRGPR